MTTYITGPGFWSSFDDEELDEMQATVIIEHLRAENNMLFDRAAQRLAALKELEADVVSLQADLAQIKMVLNRFKDSEDIKLLREQYRRLAGKEMGDWIERRRQS
jgi:hypothetical protein